MKTVLFITLNDIKSFDIKSIYTDLAKEFLKKGHQVIFISPTEKNIKLGIITDGYKETQNNKIKVLELKRYIDKIIVTDELGRDFWKPHPKSYKIMKDYFNVKYEEMIYIGDNESKDFISPEKLGMKWLKIFRKNSIYNENSKESDIMSLSTILDLI